MKTANELTETMHQAKTDLAREVTAHALYATRDYENARNKLTSQLEYLRDEIGRALNRLAEGGRPNSLGVLQGNGVDADRRCGELARLAEAATAAQDLMAALNVGAERYIDQTAAVRGANNAAR